MEWHHRRVVRAATVTTHAKPHVQQQLARARGGARCHGAALSASKVRRSAAMQSAVFLVNCSYAALQPTYVGVLQLELSLRSAVRKFNGDLGINMTMKKIFLFVPVHRP